jgi:hypothetical protein
MRVTPTGPPGGAPRGLVEFDSGAEPVNLLEPVCMATGSTPFENLANGYCWMRRCRFESVRLGRDPPAEVCYGRCADRGRPMAPENADRAVYEQLCANYRAIDDFRMKLLGLLPFATGAGVLLLLREAKGIGSIVEPWQFLLAAGTLGFLATLGLFSYELHGIKKCGQLICTGKNIEEQRLAIRGPFSTRPQQVGGLIDEPFAASVVYPASLAGWTFLALAAASAVAALIISIAVFLVFFRLSLSLIRDIEVDLGKPEEPRREPASAVALLRYPLLRRVWWPDRRAAEGRDEVPR